MTLRAESPLESFVIFWLTLAALVAVAENSITLKVLVGTVNVFSSWWIPPLETRRCTEPLRPLRCLSEVTSVRLCRHMNKLRYVPDAIIMANDTIIERKRDGIHRSLPQDTTFPFWWLLSFVLLTEKRSSVLSCYGRISFNKLMVIEHNGCLCHFMLLEW